MWFWFEFLQDGGIFFFFNFVCSFLQSILHPDLQPAVKQNGNGGGGGGRKHRSPAVQGHSTARASLASLSVQSKDLSP